MTRLLTPLLIAACLACLLAAGSAQAESPATADCYAHNKLTHRYSVAQLRSAMASMPADIKEYTDCYQVEEDQLFRDLHKPVPGASSAPHTSSGSSFISTPLLVVLIVVVLAGGGLAYVAWRRGGGGGSPPTAAAS
jgi:hypothetical protein